MRLGAARCCSTGSGRAAAAGRTLVRSPAAPIPLFSDIPVRGDDGARAVGAIDDDDDDDDDVGLERRRWWRRRVAQRGSATYGVIDSDRQILQH